jgi:hypothetical protein
VQARCHPEAIRSGSLIEDSGPAGKDLNVAFKQNGRVERFLEPERYSG